jgi:hypothetical protein
MVSVLLTRLTASISRFETRQPCQVGFSRMSPVFRTDPGIYVVQGFYLRDECPLRNLVFSRLKE